MKRREIFPVGPLGRASVTNTRVGTCKHGQRCRGTCPGSEHALHASWTQSMLKLRGMASLQDRAAALGCQAGQGQQTRRGDAVGCLGR